MDTPNIPDPNKAAIAGAIQDAKNFPFKAQIDALAQMGGKAVINGKTYDFTGLGTGDNNAAVSDKMAQAMLDIQKNYGSAYIKQRLADLQQSDPAGYAARKQMFDRILADAEKNPDRPIADDLQAQISQTLSQGGKLTDKETQEVQQGVRGQQLQNGIFLGNAATAQEAGALVNAGDQMKQQRQQQAVGFLNSGVSPEDVTYRRVQQGLSNLGNAINGTSPTAQFPSLSGAQSQAAPFAPGQVSYPTLNPNAGIQGMQDASQIYSGNVNWSQTQVNPWTVGLSTGLNATAALNSMGAFSNQNTNTGSIARLASQTKNYGSPW